MKKIFAQEDESLMALSNAFRQLIQGAIVEQDFNIDDLYLNERSFIIVEIRRKTKGDQFQFELKCPDCKSQSMITIDLSGLVVTPIPENIDPIVKLDDNFSVELDFITLAHERELLESGIDNETDMTLSVIAASIQAIHTPAGIQTGMTLKDKIFFTDEIPQPLYEKIVDWHGKNDFGIELETTLKCPHCEKERKTTIEPDSFFF
jgi:hypothetical protein